MLHLILLFINDNRTTKRKVYIDPMCNLSNLHVDVSPKLKIKTLIKIVKHIKRDCTVVFFLMNKKSCYLQII